jgi:serine/threonine protein kinase
MQCPKCQTNNPDDSKYCKKCATSLTGAPDALPPFTRTLEVPVEELRTGTTFADRYQIIEELGKGGMGSVYKVLDKEINTKVALKLIKPEIAADQKTIERFRNELKVAREVTHKNVCRMHDLSKTDNSYFITMEYVEGQDLKSLIRQTGRLAVPTAISLTKQICEGLSEAHKKGVIHRDLKPSNIMVDKAGNAHIMDFGIARSMKAKGVTGEGVMIGTPEYMSPEQAEARELDHRSDLYSLAVMLYEMVTGQLPFEGDTPLSIAVKHKSEVPKEPSELNPQIPESLNRFILQGLEKDKAARFESARAAVSLLDTIEFDLPTTQSKAPRRTPRPSREITLTLNTSKVFVPVLLVAAVVVVAFILWRVWSKSSVLPAAEKIENSIAVIIFENQTGDPAFDYLRKAIPNLLITSLEQAEAMYVMTWERMNDLLKQMGEEDIENIDQDLGFELCRREGVERVVLGSFVKAGNTFATDVKVLDVDTKKSLKSAGSRGEGLDSILKIQIDELSRKIIEGIGIRGEKSEAPRAAVADVTTDSMDAYKYYISGVENHRRFYYEDARSDLEKAVAVDPTFAMAYFYLAKANDSLANLVDRDAAIKNAKNYAAKATEKEKLYIDLGFTEYIEKDLGKTGNLARQITESYPQEKLAHQYLGSIFQNYGNYAGAIKELQKVLELDPENGEAHNSLGYTYILLEDYEAAVLHFKEYLSLNPGDANPHDSLADAYFLLGRLDEAIFHSKEAVRIKPDYGPSFFKLAYIYAVRENPIEAFQWIEEFIEKAPSSGVKRRGYLFKAFYHFWLGNTVQAFLDLKNVEEQSAETGRDLGKAAAMCLKGVIHRSRGDLERARELNEGWLGTYEESQPALRPAYRARYQLLAGLIDLGEGKLQSARNLLVEAGKSMNMMGLSRRERLSFYVDILDAEILLAEGKPEAAAALLEGDSSLNVPPPYLQYLEAVIYYNIPILRDVLARAYQHQGEVDKAIAEYERLITFDPESKARFLIHPLYYYRLARLYEDKGWSGKAIDHYEKFLEIWKDADPGFFEVEQARDRVAELKDNLPAPSGHGDSSR